MLLGEGVFAGQGTEAQRGNQSGALWLAGGIGGVSEARAGQAGERAVLGEELAGQECLRHWSSVHPIWALVTLAMTKVSIPLVLYVLSS